MSSRRISVVVPVYNEHENIATCLRQLWAALQDLEHEILVCYDFDGDSTLPAIAAMSDKPPSLRLVKNMLGKGAANALRAGFAAATGDVVVTTMADLSDPPAGIPRMAEIMRREGCAVVAGSRYVYGGSQKGGPLVKRFLSRTAGLLMHWITGVGTHDATNNFRAYSKSFLDSISVESQTGFEIALELTTKAHLKELEVAEIPSSWVDRSAGESRFQLWKWLPKYLHWWLQAMREPIAVWAVFAVAFGVSWWRASTSVQEPAFQRAAVVVCAFAATTTLFWTRGVRRRNRIRDIGQVLVWLLPTVPVVSLSSTWLASVGAALVLCPIALALALGPATWKRGVRASWTQWGHLVSQGNVGLVVLALLFWVTRLIFPTDAAATDLDDGWQQVIGHGLVHGLQWGVDLDFTFGPLGYFARGTYMPELYWYKILWWEFALKLILAGAFMLYARRMTGALEKSLYLFAVLVSNAGFDSLFFLAIVGLVCWVIHHPRLGLRWMLFVMALLTVIALNKFTSLVLVGFGMTAIGVHRWRTQSLGHGARILIAFAIVFLTIYTLIGQHPWNLPAYIRSGLLIARGHNEAMAWYGPPVEVKWAAVLLLGAFLVGLCHILSRPRNATVVLATLVVWFGSFVAYKAGFTRHGGNSNSYFTFAAVALFFLLPTDGGTGFWRKATVTLRCGAVVAAFYAQCVVLSVTHELPKHLPVSFIGNLESGCDELRSLPRKHLRLGARMEQARVANDLPTIRGIIGSQTVDLLLTEQGVLLLNGFNYRPRPVFQSYCTYLPELSDINYEFFRSDRAPHFVILRFMTLDERLPNMDDGRVMLSLLRDYKFVIAEKGYLLLERAPQPEPPEARVVFERKVRAGDWIEMKDVPGNAHLLSMGIGYSLAGKLQMFYAKAPLCFLEVAADDSGLATYRIAPQMLVRPILFNPWTDNGERWSRLLNGVPRVHVARFRVVVPPEFEAGFQPEITVKLHDATAWMPPADPERAKRSLFSVLGTLPLDTRTEIDPSRATIAGREVLVVHAPSELQYELAPGKQRLQAVFGLPDSAWREGKSDGVDFSAVVRGSDRKETTLWQRHLDPRNTAGDRGHLTLDLEFDLQPGDRLFLRTGPGPDGDKGSDWAYWSSITIR